MWSEMIYRGIYGVYWVFIHFALKFPVQNMHVRNVWFSALESQTKTWPSQRNLASVCFNINGGILYNLTKRNLARGQEPNQQQQQAF
jgi:hypothetical protein